MKIEREREKEKTRTTNCFGVSLTRSDSDTPQNIRCFAYFQYLGSCWGHVGGHFGVILGSCWDSCMDACIHVFGYSICQTCQYIASLQHTTGVKKRILEAAHSLISNVRLYGMIAAPPLRASIGLESAQQLVPAVLSVPATGLAKTNFVEPTTSQLLAVNAAHTTESVVVGLQQVVCWVGRAW